MKSLKRRIGALAAFQWMTFTFILMQWHDRTVAEVLTSWNVLLGYALLQVWLHKDLYKIFKDQLNEEKEKTL